MLGMQVEVECYWEIWCRPTKVVHYSPNWVGRTKRGVSRGSEACRCIERHLEWQD